MTGGADEPGPRGGLALAGALALVATVVRLFFALATPDRSWAHSPYYEGDALVWWEWSRALADPRVEFEYGLAMRAPGVPFLLHGLQVACGGLSFVFFKVLWCVLGGLGCGAAYLAFRRAVPERTARLAGWLSVFAYGGYVQAGSLNGEAPYGALLCFLVLGHLTPARAWSVPLLGIGHGLATLLRPEHTLLLLLLAVRDLRRGRKRGAVALLLGASLLPILPWTVSTHAATVRFNEVETQAPPFDGPPRWTQDGRAFAAGLPAFARAGNVAWLNAHLGANGVAEIDAELARTTLVEEWGYVPEPLATWNLVSGKAAFDFAVANHPSSSGGFSRAALSDGRDAVPEFAFGRPSHLYLYNHGWRAGLRSMRDHWGAWLGLVAAKLGIFVEGASLGYGARDLPYGSAARRRPVDQATPRGGLGWRAVWGALVLVGVASAWRKTGVWLLVIGAKLAVCVVFYGYARQAASIQPAFQLFLALGITTLWTRVGLPRISPIYAAAPFVLLLLIDAWRANDPGGLELGGEPAPLVLPGPPEMPQSFVSLDDLTLDPQ